MHPRRSIEISSSLPSRVEYWVPKPSEMADEGYGLFFRDVHVLNGVSAAEANGVLQWERRAADWVADGARDEREFESRARMVESFDPDAPAEETPDELPLGLRETDFSLWGLELGVSGLSHVLAATGFYPVASCRSHVENSWSPAPVVLLATDEERLQRLQTLAKRNGCGLDVDDTRGRPLFCVYAASIVDTMALAQALFDNRGELGKLPKTSRKRSPLPASGKSGSKEQTSLF